jgi:hypothetical protein
VQLQLPGSIELYSSKWLHLQTAHTQQTDTGRTADAAMPEAHEQQFWKSAHMRCSCYGFKVPSWCWSLHSIMIDRSDCISHTVLFQANQPMSAAESMVNANCYRNRAVYERLRECVRAVCGRRDSLLPAGCGQWWCENHQSLFTYVTRESRKHIHHGVRGQKWICSYSTANSSSDL